MATIASLVDDVRPMIAVAVPERAAIDAIRWSAREFLRKSRWLRETITVEVDEGINTYALTPADESTEVFAIQAAQIGVDDYLRPETQEAVKPETRGYYFFEPPADIILSWSPTADDDGDEMLVRSVLNVKINATAIPDAVLAQWNAAISYGALHRLLSMARAPWFNADLAKHYGGLWSEDLGVARTEAELQSKAYAYGSVQG